MNTEDKARLQPEFDAIAASIVRDQEGLYDRYTAKPMTYEDGYIVVGGTIAIVDVVDASALSQDVLEALIADVLPDLWPFDSPEPEDCIGIMFQLGTLSLQWIVHADDLQTARDIARWYGRSLIGNCKAIFHSGEDTSDSFPLTT